MRERKRNSPREIRSSTISGAFTLIEVMVAIAIFALLTAAVYSTWVVIIRSAQAGQAAAARVQHERIAIRTLEDSLTCIQSFQASMGYYTFNVTNGDEASLSFVARVPDIFPRDGRFDSNLRRLTYSVAAGDNLERNLVLRQNPILMDLDQEEQQEPLVLARNVKSFIIECWDTNALGWVDGWDSTNSLPPMVRITLAVNRESKNDIYNTASSVLTITREIAIPSSTLPATAQTGSPVGRPGLGTPPVPATPGNPGNVPPNGPGGRAGKNFPNPGGNGRFGGGSRSPQ